MTRIFSLTVIALMALNSISWAQPGRRPGSSQGGSGRSQLANFGRKAPQVGEQLPDITLFRADGSPLKLRDLKGHYSVLVFGCLT